MSKEGQASGAASLEGTGFVPPGLDDDALKDQEEVRQYLKDADLTTEQKGPGIPAAQLRGATRDNSRDALQKRKTRGTNAFTRRRP